MEAAVEVALPASVDSTRVVRSPDGFGSGGVVVGEVRWQTDGACSSGAKDVCRDICHLSSLHNNDDVKVCGCGNMSSRPLKLNPDSKPVLPKSGKLVRKNCECNKRSGMGHMDVSEPKPGLLDEKNGALPDFASSAFLASSSLSCNVSEKSIVVKQKNSSTSRRGYRRNTKSNCKSRSDSSALKNGLVGFDSAAGGKNFIGLGSLKSNVFDLTKYANEPTLDELLRGSYSCPLIEEKMKPASNSNCHFLQSVRNAYSILRTRKVSQYQTAETDESLVQKDSSSMDAVISADGGKEASCPTDTPTLEKEPEDRAKSFDTPEPPLYKPRDILERLALPKPMDLDVLFSYASKSTLTSKNSTDARLGKLVSPRRGLPPFPWSHPFSGHSNKLSSDAVKLSPNRTICPARWVRVKNSTALQKGCADFLKNFESLTFDQSLVPIASEHPENEDTPIERVFSASGASSPPKSPTDEFSIDASAAQTLLDMAACLKKNSFASVNLPREPIQTAPKASKSKSTEMPENSFQAPKSTIRSAYPIRAHDRFSSKKPTLSTGVTKSPFITHPESSRSVTFVVDTSLAPLKSPPRKLPRDPIANTDSHCTNLAKKSRFLKSPRGEDSKPKSRKSSQ